MKKEKCDILAVVLLFLYHIGLISLAAYLCFFYISDFIPPLSAIWIDVLLLGLVGGCTYCMRGIYTHYCVKKDWDNRWVVWHIIRPFVSAICGMFSLLFIKSGILVFGVSGDISHYYGVYALAFIAGLNVDNFLKKIESIFQEILGIRQSRSSGDRESSSSEEKQS